MIFERETLSMNRLTKYLISSKNPAIRSVRLFLTRIPAFQWIVSTIVYRRFMPDYEYIKVKYKEVFGVYPNLENPQTFNEKNCWRKLYDRNDYYTLLVDKYEIKKIIIEKLGEEYTFKLLGAWDKPEDIDFTTLPEQFVLKVNHAGGIIVCRDKQHFNQKAAIAELRRQLKRDFYVISREWPYKNVKRKIIAEEYKGENLIDYKNYCFNGQLKYTLVWQNRSNTEGKKPTAYYTGSYDRDWNRTDMELDYPSENILVEKPACYDEMIKIAETMSQGLAFVRVDCYIIDEHPYIGEMTFFPWGGFQKFKDEKWNIKLGAMENLSSVKNS